MAKQARSNISKKVAAGVGIAALAAAAAGAMYLYGTESGKKKRKEIKSWSLRMWADVMDRMEKMKDWSEAEYHQIIDTVAKKYKAMKDVDTKEVAEVVSALKKYWKTIKKEVEGVAGGKKKSKKSAK